MDPDPSTFLGRVNQTAESVNGSVSKSEFRFSAGSGSISNEYGFKTFSCEFGSYLLAVV